MDEKFTFFWHGPFSQWHECNFLINTNMYNTAEQYMMASKARTFFDGDSIGKILESTSPKEQKALGRKVKDFDPNEWNKVAKKFVFVGNYAKFTQNENLKKALLATMGTTLVEASPFDKIWGIGMKENNPRALDRNTWNGTNWLGEVLTQVRDYIYHEAILSGVDFETIA